MKKNNIIFIFFLILMVPVYTYPAEKMRIVVMNLNADGISSKIANTISNMLRNELININKFTIVERTRMDAILKEQGIQQTGCTDQVCAVEIGKLMSAKKILVGEVSQIGKAIVTTVRIVDVEKGVSEFAATQKAESEEAIDSLVDRILYQLVARIEGKIPEQPVDRKNGKSVADEGTRAFNDLLKQLGVDTDKIQTTKSGLQYYIRKTGNGGNPVKGQTITAHYVGYLANGQKFDSSFDRNQPFTTAIGAGRVIPGWDEAFLGMEKGEKRILIIPYHLAYGEKGYPGVIPPKATLIFDVELLDFK